MLNEDTGPKDPPKAGQEPQEPILRKMIPQDPGNHAPKTLVFTRKIENFMFYYKIRDLLDMQKCAPRSGESTILELEPEKKQNRMLPKPCFFTR